MPMKSLKKLVVLSGAGMSAESGIATFRGSGGLWEGYKVEEVATPEAFHANPLTIDTMKAMRSLTYSKVDEIVDHVTLFHL